MRSFPCLIASGGIDLYVYWNCWCDFCSGYCLLRCSWSRQMRMIPYCIASGGINLYAVGNFGTLLEIFGMVSAVAIACCAVLGVGEWEVSCFCFFFCLFRLLSLFLFVVVVVFVNGNAIFVVFVFATTLFLVTHTGYFSMIVYDICVHWFVVSGLLKRKFVWRS